jgi:hypothetical protein
MQIIAAISINDISRASFICSVVAVICELWINIYKLIPLCILLVLKAENMNIRTIIAFIA